MAAFNKFDSFTFKLAQGVFDCSAPNALKVYLSNQAPVATDDEKADIVEIAAGNGYSAGGESTQNTLTTSGGVASVVGVDVTWTATGGTIGPFQYVILYDDTVTGDPLIGWWAYPGSPVTLNPGETFTVDFGSSMFTVT